MKKDLFYIKKKLLEKPFKPNIFLSNTHLQTILGVTRIDRNNKIINKLLRRKFKVFRDIIEGDCYWKEDRESKSTIIIVHGIGGSSREAYILRFVKKAFENNYNIVALNLRSCGGTEGVSKKLYNAGNSKDILYVIKELIKKYKLSKFFVLGFSLGGNICLRFAGEIKNNYFNNILGVAAISPLVNLKKAQKNIDYEYKNRIYKKRILGFLKKLIEKKHTYFHRYNIDELDNILSIREFDQAYHVDMDEFKSVDFYYDKVSALSYFKKIQLPTLIIHSKDDSIIPINDIIKSIKINKNIIGLISNHGGHAGFISNKSYEDLDEYWAENRVLEFFDYLR